MRILVLAALWGGTAAAQIPDDREDWGAYEALSAIANKCDDPALDLPSPHVIRPEREARTLAAAMLKVDPALCPGTTAEGVRWLLGRIGDPERAEVDVGLLRIGWKAAEKGIGMERDPALADRFGRVLWLFDEQPPALERTSEAELQAWLRQPATIALLDARNADNRLRTRRSLQLHSDIALTRGHPAYDPAKAARLMEDGQLMAARGTRQKLEALLTDGTHLPPDHARAARIWLGMAAYQPYGGEAQGALHRIGLAAAAAAKTKAEIATALRILSAASIDGRHDSAVIQAELLRKAGRVRPAALTEAQKVAISEALDSRIAFDLPDDWEDDPAELKPIVLRALIGPDGRAIRTEIVQSSGSPHRDRIVQGVWISNGADVDLGPTARGRFVRVLLPAIPPKLTGMQVLEAANRREEEALLARVAAARRSPAAPPDGPAPALVASLEELARWYDSKGRHTQAEPVVRELAGLFPLLEPRDLAVRRLPYDAWVAKELRHRGRFDEAAAMERERKERMARLGVEDLSPPPVPMGRAGD